MRHVAARHQVAVKKNNIANLQLFDVFALNRRFKGFIHSVTPLWERIS